jgi:hypothetical protein
MWLSNRFTVTRVSYRWMQVDAGGREEEEKNKQEDRKDCISTATPYFAVTFDK